MSRSSAIVLPRPNPGPEPWPSPSAWPWIGAAVAIVALGLGIARLRRRPPTAVPVQADQASDPPTLDPIRGVLVAAFGKSWAARTTEEIAASVELHERFGADAADRIVAYLHAIDAAKFSCDLSGPDDDLRWWAERFEEEMASIQQTGSQTIGKKNCD